MRILYEDGKLVIPEKPQNLDSEEKPGDCLPARLRAYLESKGEGGEIYPVHRLDRPTGGAIVYAKTSTSAAELSKIVAERRMEKRYLAVIVGRPTDEEGELTDALYHDRRTNKVFVVKNGKKGAKEARLRYRLLECSETKEGVLSLVEVELITGRTHQIRAQFASRRLPVFGDRRYGAPTGLPGGAIALWSHRIAFALSDDGKTNGTETVCVTSAPPDEYPWNCFCVLEDQTASVGAEASE